MNYQKLEPKKYELGIISKEGIYFNSPSDFAKINLYYPHFGGQYTCASPYRVERENYNTFLLIRVLEGKFHVNYDGDHSCVKAGSVIFLDCKKSHAYWAEMPVTFQWFHFDGCATQAYFNLLTEDGQSICFSDNAELSFQFGNLLNELKTDNGDDHKLSFLIHNILGLLAMPDKRKEPSTVTDALRYMTSHYQKNISVEDIARQLSLNPQYFSRLFKKYTGTSPHQHLVTLRLRRAKSLLLETSLSISQIADECGFMSSTHFIRAFKQENDITPQKFRKLYEPGVSSLR